MSDQSSALSELAGFRTTPQPVLLAGGAFIAYMAYDSYRDSKSTRFTKLARADDRRDAYMLGAGAMYVLALWAYRGQQARQS
jgi:hypothetical protein